MEGRCKTCRKWFPHSGFEFESPPKEWGECVMTQLGHDGKPLNTETLAYAVEQDEWEAVLVTAPDFGCVQWEPKGGKDA